MCATWRPHARCLDPDRRRTSPCRGTRHGRTARPPGHRRRLPLPGPTPQYLEGGSRPPLLLVHGHEESATSWRWVVPTLARTHRVLAVSLPGYGDTAPGAYGP